MKLCSKCKLNKSTDKFAWKNRSKGIYSSYCKQCQRLYAKSHYDKDPSYYLAKNKYKRLRQREWYIEYKNTTPCVDCGNTFPHYIMEFDHLDGKPSTHVSREVSGTWKSLQAEINKCDLVCANCHATRTYLRRQGAVA